MTIRYEGCGKWKIWTEDNQELIISDKDIVDIQEINVENGKVMFLEEQLEELKDDISIIASELDDITLDIEEIIGDDIFDFALYQEKLQRTNVLLSKLKKLSKIQ